VQVVLEPGWPRALLLREDMAYGKTDDVFGDCQSTSLVTS